MSNTPIKIGYCLSLSGGLAANGQTARLAHQVWQERVNARGGLLGRDVELICVDDKSDATTVAGIYEKLLSEEKADLLLGSSDIADFAKPEARVVVAPASYASGELVVPYRAAAAAR